jgi:hypothetical protein
MKSEILVRATAELAQQVANEDLTAKNLDMEKIINETATNSNRGTVHGSVPAGSGEAKKEVPLQNL